MRKTKFMAKKFSDMLVLIALTALVIYVLFLFNQDQIKKEYLDQTREIFVETPTKPPTTPTPPPITATAMPTPTPTLAPTERPEFTAMIEKYNNEDIIGLIEIEGTSIFYPIVQYEDNDFYLSRNVEKKPDIAGSIFMDYENDITKDDKNVVIYGHNMNADIMFHSLRNYMKEDFLNEHKYIKISTLYDDYVYEVFSVYKTLTDFYYIQVFFNDNEFETLLNEMKARSIFDTGVEVTKDDNILTLSTCSNLSDDSRFVVNAKLISKTNIVPIPSETPNPTQSPQPSETES